MHTEISAKDETQRIDGIQMHCKTIRITLNMYLTTLGLIRNRYQS